MLHKHTHAIIDLINEFCGRNEFGKGFAVTHCIFESGVKKKAELKGDAIQLELNSYKKNDDLQAWHYVLRFNMVNEKHAASQEMFFELSEVLKGLANRVSINIPKMQMDIIVMEEVQVFKRREPVSKILGASVVA